MATPTALAGAGPRDALKSVDEILEQLDRLAATELSETDFYAGLAARLSSLGCTSAAIWLINKDGDPEFAWRSRSSEAAGDLHTSYSPAVAAALTSGQPKILDKAPGGNGTSTSAQSIIAPWSATQIIPGALQVWVSEKLSSATLTGYLQVLAAVGELVANFLARQEQRRLRRQSDWHSQLDAFNRSLHETLDLDSLAYRIANDGRVLLGCDRLAVAIRRGSKHKITAVSGADHVHRRSESIDQLQKLCQTIVASGEPLWHGFSTATMPPSNFAPQIQKAVSDYLDISPAVSLAVVPLFAPAAKGAKPAPPVGVLVFEQYDRPFDPALPASVSAIADHCRLALTNAERIAAIPGHRFWLSLANRGWFSRTASRTFLALVALATIAAVLFAVPADVKIKATGELQPKTRHEVFAPRDGVVTAIHVDHASRVKAGEALLEMRSPDLDLEIQRVAGELETARKRLAAAQSERLQTRTTDTEARLRQRRLTAEEEQLSQQVRDLTDCQNMLAKQKSELNVSSPVSGEVITWNVQQQLATRPLRRGDALLTVADVTGPWQLELKIDSRRAGRILAAQAANSKNNEVSFMLATDPGRSLTGTLEQISARLETDPSGDTYLVATVSVPLESLENPTPGASAFARIHCGRGNLAQAWFHDLIDAARLWMPF